VQLQRSAADLKARGIGLAAISYDPPATLKAFAEARGITFPLLSDADSSVIRRYGLLNAEAQGRTAGIPHPGTFMLDRRGVVVTRAFEQAYQERTTASSLLRSAETAGVTSTRAETAHVVITSSASDDVVAPGSRFSLHVDVAPKPTMHVYAPAPVQPYLAVRLTVASTDGLRAHPPTFPPGETYLFKPLNERQIVYSKPFRIVQSVTLPVTPATRQRAAKGEPLEISATLHYQACDDTICYRPVDVPLTWTLKLEPLAR
jgi:hypothetical protein